jgi:hypothetical protein
VLVGYDIHQAPDLAGDTWEWDGAKWALKEANSLPGWVLSAVLFYEPTRGRMLMVGLAGMTPTAVDLWEWDGAHWTKLTEPAPPTNRRNFLAAFDPVRKALVLFGGENDTQVFAETWEWKTSVGWAKRSPNPVPPGRLSGALAWHDGLQKLVLFGGNKARFTQNRQLANDTWTWDGTTWTEVLNATPPGPRFVTSAAWEPVLKKLLLASGYDPAGQPLKDTWSFDGTKWSAGAAPDRPNDMSIPTLVTADGRVLAQWSSLATCPGSGFQETLYFYNR